MAHTLGQQLADIIDGTARPTQAADAHLAELATRHGSLPALTFIDYATQRNGERRTLTYAELDRAATAVAAKLQQIAPSGERVAILAPQGIEYVVGFFGALRARLIAVPLFSPDLPGHSDRLVSVMADCAPRVALTVSAGHRLVADFLAEQKIEDCAIVEIDTIADGLADQFTPTSVELHDIAYLQYTSGSTRVPAGVQITHRALVANSRQACEALEGADQPERCDMVSWLPLFHDMGLVSVAGGIIAGWHAILMDPVAFLMKPIRWIQELSSGNAVISSAPNFAFDFAAAKITDEQKANLRLDKVVTLGNGAEPVRPDTIARFNAAFAQQGLNPAAMRSIYGLAEATVYVTGRKNPQAAKITTFDLGRFAEGIATDQVDDEAAAIALPSSGTPIGQFIAIADPVTTTRLAEGHIGEIWVHGPNVGSGYWNKPETSAETFDLALGNNGELPSKGWMRTGDLGVIHDGELYVTGRMKDLIILDGRNHYPQDLEATVESAHEIVGRHRTAAFAVSTEEGEAVVVVAEISRHAVEGAWDYSEVCRTIRRTLSARHKVSVLDVLLVRPNEVPRTSSGKIARSATKDRYRAGALALAASGE